jgi:hypothetical protein
MAVPSVERTNLFDDQAAQAVGHKYKRPINGLFFAQTTAFSSRD